MDRQAIVIGLGHFGMALARSLEERGVEVIAVDKREEIVQEASAFVTQALCFDATEDESLAGLAPASRDLCVCAVGEDSREPGILVTALLRQMGAPYVLARAHDPLSARILRLVGAHEVINPEQAMGERMATRLLYDEIRDEVPLGEDLLLSQLDVPEPMQGRTLAELELSRRFGVTVVAIRRQVEGRGEVVEPDAHEPLRRDDLLVVVSRPGATEELASSF